MGKTLMARASLTPDCDPVIVPENSRALVERVARMCAEAGTSLTPFRQAILDEIASNSQPLGAYSLAARLSTHFGKNIAPNSIYRVLELFCELGVVRRVESRHAYCLVTSDDTSPVLLMCDDCGGIQAVSSGEVHEAVLRQIEAAGFRPNRQVLEVAGRCQNCHNAN